MVIVNVISATGRLKNKIDFSYSVSVNSGEIILDSGIIYSTDLSTVTSGTIRSISYNEVGTFSATFENIPNNTYYAVAYAYDNGLGSNVYSTPVQFRVSDSGYELSDDGVTIVNPLFIKDANEGIERVLTSDSSGIVNWKPIKSLFNFGHYIGEFYGGGIVIDVWLEGDDEKVLIVSLEDLKSTDGYFDENGSIYSQWIYDGTSFDPFITSTMSTILIGENAQSLYNGRLNTISIMEESSKYGVTGSAAQVCADYRAGGYDDWYLPSYYELNTIYNQSGVVNKILNSESIDTISYSGYWSSTEYSSEFCYTNDNGWFKISKKEDAYFGSNPPRIRAVRKESKYVGDGLCLNLDVTNDKSFSDSTYKLLGTSSRWVDLVSSGMTSSYSFNLSSYPPTSSEGTTIDILPTISNINGPGTTYSGNSYRDALGNFIYDEWYLTNITNSVTTTPIMYNNGGTSSFISKYFLVEYKDSSIQFQTSDVSSILNSSGANINVYISIQKEGYSTPYTLLKEVTGTGLSTSDIKIPLYSYHGKTVSIKITAPNASYTSSSVYTGPSIDEVIVSGTDGGYQATGPVYFTDDSGFLRFSSASFSNIGSYVDFKAPIGNSTKITVEAWLKLGPNGTPYSGSMIFGWNIYDVYTSGGGLGFNTGAADLYGISNTTVQNLNIIDRWAHYVFEMVSGESYSNNKIYINGNEQVLSQVIGTQSLGNRNFNGGFGRIGGWKSVDKYFMNMDVSIFRIYNRSLTKDEIMKNYNIEKKRYEILPSVMQNNLKMNFDSNSSYSGSGNTIIELSGNHTDGNIVTTSGYVSPTYSSSQTPYPGKYFTFNGFNTKIEYDPIILSENMSWEAWIRCTGTVSSPNTNLTGSVNMFMGQVLPYFGFQNDKILFSNYINNKQTYLRSTSGLELNKWYHVVFTTETISNNTLSKVYINGIKSVESYNTGTQSKFGGNDFNFAIGDGQGTDRPLGFQYTYPTQWYPFNGDVAQVRVYYKTLSYEEVKNNYDTFKHSYEDEYNDSNKFFSHEFNGNPTFSISQNLVLDIEGKGNNKILRSDENGLCTWVDKSYFLTKPTNYRYIGELYGGGIIVAMWKYPTNVFNYLVMSLEDISSSSVFSNVSASASNATSEHNGISNSNTIMSQPGHTTSAAKLCDDYTGGGFTNWYLPSITELNSAFNASQVIDSVLGSDLLKPLYWSSTESGTNTAYAYEFKSLSSTGLIKDDVSKSSTASVRAFRHVRVYDIINTWQNGWETGYTPIWQGPNPWSDENWTFNTTISIDIDPIVQNVSEFFPGIISITFSNIINTEETIINTGVCWATSSTTPTISNYFTYSTSIGPTTFEVNTGNISGPISGTLGQTNYVPNIIFFRAFVTTSSGTYYSNNTNYPNGGNYYGSGSILKTYPSNSYTRSISILYE